MLLFSVKLSFSVTPSPGTAVENDFDGKPVNVTFQPGEKGPKSVQIGIVDDSLVEPKESFTVSISSTTPGVVPGKPAFVNIQDNDASPPPLPKDCKKTDIIFVLDRSGSIRRADYEHMREFLLGIGKELKIGERNDKGEIMGQGAIVTFSEKGEKRLTLAESQTPGEFAKIVRSMPGPLEQGRTKTHLGLAVADKELATKEAGLRVDDPSVVKIFMVITDGEQTRGGNYVSVKDAMKPFFARDMDVFAVGVGLKSQRARGEIRDMVEVPENAILTENYEELSQAVENFIRKFCPVVPTKICGTEKDDCHKFATCTDTDAGSYTCTCKEGFSGDGKTMCEAVIIGFTKMMYDANEKDKKAVVQIAVQSGEITSPVSVVVNTSRGTAGADDFVGLSDTITFQPGETGPKSVEIELLDDDVVEDAEKFTVSLTTSSPVQLGNSSTVNIADEDRITFDFVERSYNVKEDEDAVVEIFVKSGKAAFPVKFSLVPKAVTAGKEDFIPKPVEVTFKPGEKGPKSAQIDIIDDPLVEETESFTVGFSSTTSGIVTGQPATVNIVDNDEIIIDFVERSYNVKEEDDAAVEIFVKSGEITNPLSVSVIPSPGTAGDNDFDGKPVNVTFQPGEKGPKSVQIGIVDDSFVERKESFTVSISSTSPGVVPGKPASVNIQDNDEGKIEFTRRVFDAREDEMAIVEMELKFAEIDTPVTVRLSTKPSTAGKEDFIPKSEEVIFQPGEKGPKPVVIELIDDTDVEQTEEFKVMLTLTSTSPILLGSDATVRITDNDELIELCGTPKDDCSKFANCRTIGSDSVECICKKGYSGNGKTCKAIEICGTAEEDCDKNATCRNTGPGLYNCTCNEGFSGDGETCEAIQICGTPSERCSGYASCKNLDPGKYECICKTGYSGDGFSCKAIEICGSPDDDCNENATCNNTGPGTYKCTCKEGFSGNGKICTEINVCNTPNDDCSDFAVCTNTGPGTFKCTCKSGYSGDGKKCEAIKICGTAKDDCSKNATCRDTGPEMYSCTCNEGYTGDGVSCKEIKICGSPAEDCSDHAACENTDPGQYSCTCKEGYTGDGKTCDAIQMCGSPAEDCSLYSKCENTGPGNYSCTCIPGYTGDGKTCEGAVIKGPILYELIPESGTVVSAAWKPPAELMEGILDYAVCYKPVSSVADEECQRNKTTSDGGILKIKMTGLSEGTTYEVIVKARNASGYGPPSNMLMVTTREEVYQCQRKTDVIFVVDRSASIRPTDYDRIRSFVQEIGKRLRVGVKDDKRQIIGQGAVVTFSNEGEVVINLRESRIPGRFDKALRHMHGPLPGGATKTHKGLSVAYKEVATVSAGMRENDPTVSKVLVVITNGAQTKEKNGFVYVGHAVQSFFDRSFDVVAVGVSLKGRRAEEELRDMVLVPENVLIAENYRDLAGEVQKLTKRICPKTKICGTSKDDCHGCAVCTDTGPGEYKCICKDGYSGDGKTCKVKKCKFDVGFLIDSSASMRDCNYEKEKNLVNDIARLLQVAPGKSHASFILYSGDAALYKTFTRAQTLLEFRDVVNTLPMMGGTTHLDKALEVAASTMFTAQNGMRDETVSKLLFVLTDGAQAAGSITRPLKQLASSLHRRNIHVVVIGAGEADEVQLRQLVQTSEDLIMVKRFENATKKAAALTDQLCSENRCKLLYRVVPVRIGRCTSMQPVKVGTCMGKCSAESDFHPDNGIFKISCLHCRPGSQATKTVVLNCPGNTKKSYEIKEAISCICEKCPWKRLR